MARIARVVVPGVPHHVTQRGNRRQPIFFSSADYQAYLRFVSAWCAQEQVEVWAYCLMPNHVHLVAVPSTKAGLARALGEAHRRYTIRVNQRENWRGYLFQGRFASCPMDERHLLLAVRYVELNPVRAGLVEQPWHYAWSSARAHTAGRDDRLVRGKPMLERVGDWREYLATGLDSVQMDILRRYLRTGRPLGDQDFVRMLEGKTGRELTPHKRGPKRRGRRRRN